MTDLDAMFTPPTIQHIASPTISITVQYRQLGDGPDEVTVTWDAGARLPDADEVCDVIHVLLGRPCTMEATP